MFASVSGTQHKDYPRSISELSDVFNCVSEKSQIKFQAISSIPITLSDTEVKQQLKVLN